MSSIFAAFSVCASATVFPVAFEANRGRHAEDVSFSSRSAGYRLLLTRDGATIIPPRGAAVGIRLLDANGVIPAGINLLAAKSNYLLGSDPTRWRTGIPNYEKVRYARVYPGVDLVWHAQGRNIEHDFVLAAGANPNRIRAKISGASPELASNGDLIAGALLLHKPRAYQDGREIECRYKVHGARVNFILGPYDRSRSLTIDPVLSFATYLGGSGDDSATSVALDPAGNIYVAGTTTSADFPVTGGSVQPAYVGGICGQAGEIVPCKDIFVAKFTNDGSTLLFSTYLGGSGDNALNGMTVDRSGSVYVTGLAQLDFPLLKPLEGNVGQSSLFVAKLTPNGSALLYSTSLPNGISYNGPTGLAVAAEGSVYLTGSAGEGLPAVNAFQHSFTKPFLFKTSDSGVHWQSLAFGRPNDFVNFIMVDPTNPRTLYLGGDYGLYKSTDAGANWAFLLQGVPAGAPHADQYLSALSLVVDPSQPQTIYLGTGLHGIFKSTDGGATWSTSGSGASRFVRMIVINPANTQALYAATDNGVYVTKNGAQSWSPTTLMAPPSTTDPFFSNLVVIDSSTPTTLYVGTGNGVMKSADGGVTWQAMNNGFTRSSTIDALAIDPKEPQNLYAATTVNFPPYYTRDGGAHWTQGDWPNSGDGTVPYVMSLLVDPVVHTTVWAVTDTGLRISNDSGATWTAPPTDLPYYNEQSITAASDGSIYVIANNLTTSAFVLKLDPTGSKIVYSTNLGGSGTDAGTSIAVDGLGRAYVTGLTSSFDFPLANALQTHPAGFWDAFVTVLDPSGSQLAWSTYLGGLNDDRPQAIAVDPAGDVHLTGLTLSHDFPLAHPAQSRAANNFVSKIKGNGSALIYSTYLGGTGYDAVYAVAADPAGNTYVAGAAASKDFPTLNALQSALAANNSAFVSSFNGQSGAFQYSTLLGVGNDAASAIAADSSGNAYVAGVAGSDFAAKYAYQSTYGGGNDDAFLGKIAVVAPAIQLGGATNAASYGAVLAPGEIFSIFGKALAITPALANAPPLPNKLSDVTVSVNGVPAPLFYVSPLQINAQVPFETLAGPAQIQVNSTAGSAMLNATIASAATAIFTLDSSGTGAGAIEHGLTGELVNSANPAKPGEIISIYCTGLGAISPAIATGAAASTPAQTLLQVDTRIAGAPAHVTYAGAAPGFPGLYQVNAEIPATTASGNQTLLIGAGGVASNTVSVAVH